ncbi:hypothetical protein AAGS40_30340 (plasmid) [Paraburkholderia sp. PREW-6R]|uniref:hypothetical protein n=1 Tax=Paraburkholderia sp. PREW-6R TaxID=3141544 RepID=UPI0031F561AF
MTLTILGKMKIRSVTAYILFYGLISIFPVAFVLSGAVADSFANNMLRGRLDPVWIGFGLATLVVAAIGVLTRMSTKQASSNRRIDTRQFFGFLLLIFAYLVFAGWMLADAGERLLVRTTSHESRYYLTSAQPMSRKCQNPVTWYDHQVDGMVFTCSTFALFNYPADSNARRASIVHVLTGPYGIRVLSIHAVDSYFGQQDLAAMKDCR